MPKSVKGTRPTKVNGKNVVIIETNYGPLIMQADAIQQSAENKKKKWRSLSSFAYPTQDFKHDFAKNLPAHLAFQLHCTFREVGYTEFTSLITIEETTLQGNAVTVITLISQHARYTGALHNAVKKLWDPAEDRKALQDKMNSELLYLYKNWSVIVKLLPIPGPTAYKFIYDPEGQKLSIAPDTKISTDPSDYPDKGAKTSEFLAFLAANLNSQVAMMNLETVLKSYALFKVTLLLLDKKDIEFDNIRIDAADPETWDYLNPEADLEFGGSLLKLQ